jgi:hypothetical protein
MCIRFYGKGTGVVQFIGDTMTWCCGHLDSRPVPAFRPVWLDSRHDYQDKAVTVRLHETEAE